MKLHVGLLLLALLGLAACDDGKDKIKKQNIKAAEYVIDKLRVHHDNTSQYPERLSEINFADKRPEVEARAYNYYRIDADTYTLQFFYQDGGTQSCTYQSKDKSWTCGPG